MAEGTYEYECMRAELLGIEKPDFDEFTKNQQEKEAAEAEAQEIENLKEVVEEEESMNRITGGLDDLNSILEVTQKKINKFKASCGSLTNLLKFKLGATSSSESVPEVAEPTTTRKSDMDKLDAMIEKADNAQYSMNKQNKDMKKFLN